jgi:hypothetical protein
MSHLKGLDRRGSEPKGDPVVTTKEGRFVQQNPCFIRVDPWLN